MVTITIVAGIDPLLWHIPLISGVEGMKLIVCLQKDLTHMSQGLLVVIIQTRWSPHILDMLRVKKKL